MTSDNGKRHDGILPKSFRKGNGGEKGVCVVRVVVGVVVMDDVVVGGWLSKIHHLSALWNVLCSSLDKVILGNDTTRALTNKYV